VKDVDPGHLLSMVRDCYQGIVHFSGEPAVYHTLSVAFGIIRLRLRFAILRYFEGVTEKVDFSQWVGKNIAVSLGPDRRAVSIFHLHQTSSLGFLNTL